jgi:hypothetical protein
LVFNFTIEDILEESDDDVFIDFELSGEEIKD